MKLAKRKTFRPISADMEEQSGERVYFAVGHTRYAVVIIPEPLPPAAGIVIPFPEPAEKVQQKPEELS